MAPTVSSTRSTRSKTGNSKPRVFATIGTTPETKKRTTTKKKTTAKANTSKPRTKKTTTGGVTKKRAPAKVKKESVGKKVADKVNGAVLKAEGAIERKPGKKVSVLPGLVCLFWPLAVTAILEAD